MTKEDWQDLTVLERKRYNLLAEVMDLSQQLGEALDRNDRVTLKMLVAMRQDPITRLEELQISVRDRRAELPAGDQARIRALAGGEPPQGEEEQTYLAQAGSARRLLERVIDLDRQLNKRLAGGDSVYE